MRCTLQQAGIRPQGIYFNAQNSAQNKTGDKTGQVLLFADKETITKVFSRNETDLSMTVL
ncbi:MAG: hypothetical protein R2688_02490 [Fimbriimonadaceae bacterium]